MPMTQSTPGGDGDNDDDTLEQEIKTKTRVMLADLPVSVNDIQNAILELATTINLEEQQKMTTMGAPPFDPQTLVQMQQQVQAQTNLQLQALQQMAPMMGTLAGVGQQNTNMR